MHLLARLASSGSRTDALRALDTFSTTTTNGVRDPMRYFRATVSVGGGWVCERMYSFHFRERPRDFSHLSLVLQLVLCSKIGPDRGTYGYLGNAIWLSGFWGVVGSAVCEYDTKQLVCSGSRIQLPFTSFFPFSLAASEQVYIFLVTVCSSLLPPFRNQGTGL